MGVGHLHLKEEVQSEGSGKPHLVMSWLQALEIGRMGDHRKGILSPMVLGVADLGGRGRDGERGHVHVHIHTCTYIWGLGVYFSVS